ALWQEMYERTIHMGRAGVVMAAISGVDLALWDLRGKALGLPVFRLLGGRRDALTPYASGGFYEEGQADEALAEEVLGYRERGFQSAKIKVGGLEPRRDARRVEAVRKAVGADF